MKKETKKPSLSYQNRCREAKTRYNKSMTPTKKRRLQLAGMMK